MAARRRGRTGIGQSPPSRPARIRRPVRIGIVGLPNAGKIDALQRADPCRRRRRQLPVHDHRAERGGGHRPRRAPDGRSRAWSARARCCPRRSSSPTSPGWSGAPRRARGSATSFWPRSGRPTRSATWSAATPMSDVPHPDGSVDPVRDIETIETELLLADLDQAERAPRSGGEAGQLGRSKEAAAERRLAPARWSSALGAGRAGAGRCRRREGPRGTETAPGADAQADPLRRQCRRG